MRMQLSTLAAQLQKAVTLVRPAAQTSKQQRATFFDGVVRVEGGGRLGAVTGLRVTGGIGRTIFTLKLCTASR